MASNSVFVSVINTYIFSSYIRYVQETRRRIHRYDIFSALLWPVWNHIPKVLYICLYVRVRERVPCTKPPNSLLHSSTSLYFSFYIPTYFLRQYRYSVFQIITTSRSIDDRTFQRTIDCSFFFLYFYITVSVRVELAWMCDSMFEPRALRLWSFLLWQKEVLLLIWGLPRLTKVCLLRGIFCEGIYYVIICYTFPNEKFLFFFWKSVDVEFLL